MEAATQATRATSAREKLNARTSIATPTTYDNTPRFFVQFGRTVLGTDCLGIPDGILMRGEITPLTGYQRTAHINTIPEGNIVAGSQTADREGRIVYAREIVFAGPEAQRLIDLERQSERKDGLFEVEALRGRMDMFTAIDFNAVFFPDGIENLPASHSDVVSLLQNRKVTIAKGGVVPSEHQAIVMSIADALIDVVEKTHKIQQVRLEDAHRQMKLPPNDPSGLFKKAYDDVDEEMLLRTGKPRLDASDDMTAEALQLLSKQGTSQNTGSNDLLAAVLEQNRLLQAQITQQNETLTKALHALSGQHSESTSAPAQTPEQTKQPRRSPFTDNK